MKWFYVELMVLNRTTAFTKEPLKNHLFESVVSHPSHWLDSGFGANEHQLAAEGHEMVCVGIS